MPDEIAREHRRAGIKKASILLGMAAVLIFVCAVSLVVGSSNLGFGESVAALFGQGTNGAVRIVQRIRLPRLLAALIAGAGLSIAGLIMQSTLDNPMASPATLGVSNAAVFGANIAIIGLSGGFLTAGKDVRNYGMGINPFAVSSIAFIFALISLLIILGLCRIRSFSRESIALAGIAMGAIWTAGTSILQFQATDVGLSAAVLWSFGDLGRATFETDLIMLAVISSCVLFFILFSWRYNALSAGHEVATSVGVRVRLFSVVSLLLASIITASVVSYLGVIGFIGIICPHAMKRILGHNHRFLVPGSLLSGALLLVVADIVSRTVNNGATIPVGAVTAILGGPFFIYLIFAKKERRA